MPDHFGKHFFVCERQGVTCIPDHFMQKKRHYLIEVGILSFQLYL